MKTWLKIIIILFMLGCIAGALLYFFVYNKPHPDFAKAKSEYSLTAAELFDSFRNDASGSENLYNGKVIQIEGNLDDRELNGEMVILVFTFDDGVFGQEGVRCTMLPEANVEAQKLIIGDYLKIKGLCTGYTDIDVILEKCSIIE